MEEQPSVITINNPDDIEANFRQEEGGLPQLTDAEGNFIGVISEARKHPKPVPIMDPVTSTVQTEGVMNPILPVLPEEAADQPQDEVLEGVRCNICLDDVTNPVTLPCSHKYCAKCIQSHFYELIKTKRSSFTCPDCYSAVYESTVLGCLTQEQTSLFHEFKGQIEIDRNPSKHWCPKTNCGKYVELPGSRPGEKKQATCECGFSFCIGCHEPWHGSKSCRKAQDQNYVKFTKKNPVKKCPKCKTAIEKNDGCNHMTCHVCTYEFCWICGGDYESGHFGGIGGCPSDGSPGGNYCALIILMPLILFLLPFILSCELSKGCFNDCPCTCCIVYFFLFWLLLALGFVMQVFLPIVYLIMAISTIRTWIKQCRFRGE